MKEHINYYVVKKKAVPEVLLKVVEAKRLLDSEKVMTVQEAAERVGISRSSFYKYKDDIFPFHDNSRGRTFTVMIQLDDQAIPVNGVASVTLSIEVLNTTGDVSELIDALEKTQGVHYLKILSRE